ncbi:MAG: AAA family ATPase [Alphaproteobacteria bacterium]
MVEEQLERDYSPEEMAQMRQQVRAIITAESLSQAKTADKAGIAKATFSAWLNGTYSGDKQRVTREVANWLRGHMEKTDALDNIPRVPAFRPTPTANKIKQTLQMAKMLPEIVVINGQPGMGKTSTLEQFALTHANVWYVPCTPLCSSPTTVMAEMLRAMHLAASAYRSADRFNLLRRQSDGREGLWILDDAQHLSIGALEMIRSLFDQISCGVALCGSDGLYAQLETGPNARKHAQLASRIGHKLSLKKPTKGDVNVLLDAWDVKDKAAAEFLHGIAFKPGALRKMTKVLQLGTLSANAAEEPFNKDHAVDAAATLEA